jgi:hypothetical protein
VPEATAPSRFTPVTPTRLADTRGAFGTVPPGRLRAGAVTTVSVTGRGDVTVPAGAVAAIVGVVSIGANGPSFTTVWPADRPRPVVSSLNVERPGSLVANLVTSRLSADGRLAISSSAATDVVVDLFGYYTPAGGAVTGGRLISVIPTRAYDSRNLGRPWGRGERRTITLPVNVVPAGSTAAILNLTAVASPAAGYWAVTPPGGPARPPGTSNLNITGPGRTIAVQVVVPIGADRTITVFSQGGGHAIVDVFGYVTGAQAPASTDGLFVALTDPIRLADTRSAATNPIGRAQALRAGWTIEIPVLNRGGVPAAASLVVANTTYVGAAGAGFLSATAAGTPRPVTSILNADAPGQTRANHTTVPVGTRGVSVYSSAGGHVLFDVAGYVTGAARPSTLPPPVYPPPGTTSCRSVAHLGDSTSVGLISPSVLPNPADRIGAQYARVGAVDQRLEISGARSIVETLPGQINAYDTARNLRAAGFRGCWVFALGTTDTANVAVGGSVSRATRIDRMMSVAAGEPVLWVNVRTLVTQGAWSNANMQLWNAELLQARSRHPNLRIFDWASVAQPGWFSGDQVHYTSIGYAARARHIADALAATYPA